MPTIHMLDQATINQIAAGEVIERPSSVVKELFENAVDAGANAITVEIKEGGIQLIRVTDNGCGIEKEQVSLAFKRHATSKIKDVMDLVSVTSLGFRGEALSSIAAVAQVELITKTPQKMMGISYRIEDGVEKELIDIGAPDGTTFLVKNLFGHVPARRKFLKSAATEANYIAQLMENLALSRPDLSVRFINNGQNKLYTSGNGKMRDLIYSIYGREIASNLLEVSAETDCFKVHGFIGKPIISRGNRSFENYYINGRFVKSSLIAKAIETGFKSFMMQHRYPFTVLHLEIDQELLDVNVHPAKMELRFRREEDIYAQLSQVIEQTLKGKQLIPDVALEKAKDEKKQFMKTPEPFETMRRQAKEEILPKGGTFYKKEPDKMLGTRHEDTRHEDTTHEGEVKEESVIVQDKSKLLQPVLKESLDYCAGKSTGMQRRIGQNTNELSKIDAVKEAEESILSPVQSIRQREEQQIETKECELSKETVQLETETIPLCFEQKEQDKILPSEEIPPLLSKEAKKKHRLIGQLFRTYWLIQYEDTLYIMDQHAAHEKVLYESFVAVYKKKECFSQYLSPAMIVTLNPIEEEVLNRYMDVLVNMGYEIQPYGGKEYAITAVPADIYHLNEKELFLDLLAGLEENGTKTLCEMVAEKLAGMSCKAAIKGNQSITFAEADALIGKLLTLDNPYACPHGRPTLIAMSKYEIEKKFKRIL